ncbi:MAG: GNAT family N-acetyltransferase [Candidatus Cloacimonetes bacterium]|nr:GNAT family N-acetyltransferase [Candidatus Cloacimonadota bacterium]
MNIIRPFVNKKKEYEAFVAVENAIWVDYPSTVEEYMHYDSTRDPKYLFQRFVIEKDGKIIGSCMCCEPWWSMKPGKYYLNVSIHPDYRRRGYGSEAYDFIIKELEKHNPSVFVSDTREDQTDSVKFLTDRGFIQLMREPTSQLDILAFDPKKFSGYAEKMNKLGIKIISLTEVEKINPNWKRMFWDLEWELLQDVPTTDPLTRQTFENFEKRTLSSPGFYPDAQFFALNKGKYVGMSALWTSKATPKKLFTGLTGVVQSHRRKGIATAMKVRAIDFARKYGATIIETDNEENNPMYFLNLKLGFKSKPAWLQYEKKLKKV